MKQKVDRSQIFSLMEEATQLLRRMPVTAWLWYYLGTLPFTVFLFFFWSDMSRSALAESRLMEYAFLLAVLYAGMKGAQAVYCGHLMAELEERPTTSLKLPFRAWTRLFSSQALIHATMPWVLALASIAVLPSAWTYAFYHNVSTLAVAHFKEGGKVGGLMKEALSQAHFEPLRNHFGLFILLVLAILAYLNLMVAFVLVTMLAKSFTGIENAFTMRPFLYLSSSVQAFMFIGTYLVMNPLIKAVYALRCFYGQSRKTGADLEARLNESALTKATTFPSVVMVLCAMVIACSSCVHAQEALPSDISPPPAGEQTGELRESIRDVLKGSEYQWRMPRESGVDKDEDGWLKSVINELAHWIESTFESIGRFLSDIWDWLTGRSGPSLSTHDGSESGGAWLAVLPKLLIGLLVLLALAFLYLLVRNWRAARQTKVNAEVPAPPEINLESDRIVATQLPENAWLNLAREKMDAGELRLALRAFFLATLSHLGEHRYLQITKTKSNGDYVRELAWRTRDREALREQFKSQVRIFDEAWYGWHEVTQEHLTQFQRQHEAITSHAT